MTMLYKLLAAFLLLFGVMGFAHAQANTTQLVVTADIPQTCRFNTASTAVDIVLDQASNVDSVTVTPLSYSCSLNLVPLFAIDGNVPASPNSRLVSLTNGVDGIDATIVVTSGGNGLGLGVGQERSASVTTTITPAFFQPVIPQAYTKTLTLGISI